MLGFLAQKWRLQAVFWVKTSKKRAKGQFSIAF